MKNNSVNGNENSENEASFSDLPEIKESTAKSGLPNMEGSSETRESEKAVMTCEEGVEMVPETFNSGPERLALFGNGKPVESHSDAFNITIENPSDMLDCSSDSEKLSSAIYPTDRKNSEGSPSPFIEPSKHGHSTLEDPNFIENYFKVTIKHIFVLQVVNEVLM